MFVGARHDRCSLGTFLAATHPHIDEAFWLARVDRLSLDGRPVTSLETLVRAGNRLEHRIPDETEPDVDGRLRFLFEDDAIVVVHKPAPLPVHPCGRFNKNTAVELLRWAFDDLDPKPVHRLDADTTGLLLLAKTRLAARELTRQFEARTVEKIYVARVRGVAPEGRFTCTQPIEARPREGGRRAIGEHGVEATTEFERVRVVGGESVVRVRLRTGRTNQIRVHLAAMGLPIVGDVYGGEEAFVSGSGICLHSLALAFDHPLDHHRLCLEDVRPSWAMD